ncbi:MAG: hypothetical protein NTY48_04430, partial [Candidatus Diapherotrites archaeon]|nr:hypothetical protein [Candidatus Diapherotrites archaeon]
SASVVSTNLDKAGTQNVFGPGPDFFGNVGNDFEWAVTLNLLSEKTIKSIIIKHIYPGSKYEEQAWSTSSERVFGLDLYPIVVFLNGTQVNNKYDEQIGPLPIGSTTLDLYGQIERSSFHGGTIDFVFTDGTTVSATIPASDLTVTPISMTGLSCSGATKADLNKFLNQTVVSSSGDGLTYSQTDYCLNDHLLAKGLCGGLNGLNKQFVNSYQPCANGCVEGKCLFEAGSSVSSNGGGSSAIAVPITT